MAVDDDPDDPDGDEAAYDAEEAAVERPLSLQRAAPRRGRRRCCATRSAHTVVDLGCGEGQAAARAPRRSRPSTASSASTCRGARSSSRSRVCSVAEMPPRQRERLELRQGALTYRDRPLEGFDAAAVVEVIEHLDPPRLDAFERVLFVHARPRDGRRDHAERRVQRAVRDAAGGHAAPPRPPLRVDARRVRGVGRRRGARAAATTVRFPPIGPDDPEVGAPTQMAVFRR